MSQKLPDHHAEVPKESKDSAKPGAVRALPEQYVNTLMQRVLARAEACFDKAVLGPIPPLVSGRLGVHVEPAGEFPPL